MQQIKKIFRIFIPPFLKNLYLFSKNCPNFGTKPKKLYEDYAKFQNNELTNCLFNDTEYEEKSIIAPR